MTSYMHNRTAFKTGSANDLVLTYCKLVQLELALKEELGLLQGQGNGGHDVPRLLINYGNTKVAHLPTKNSITSAATKIGNRLNAIWCQNQNGAAQKVPRRSYPNMR